MRLQEGRLSGIIEDGYRGLWTTSSNSCKDVEGCFVVRVNTISPRIRPRKYRRKVLDVLNNTYKYLLLTCKLLKSCSLLKLNTKHELSSEIRPGPIQRHWSIVSFSSAHECLGQVLRRSTKNISYHRRSAFDSEWSNLRRVRDTLVSGNCKEVYSRSSRSFQRGQGPERLKYLGTKTIWNLASRRRKHLARPADRSGVGHRIERSCRKKTRSPAIRTSQIRWILVAAIASRHFLLRSPERCVTVHAKAGSCVARACRRSGGRGSRKRIFECIERSCFFFPLSICGRGNARSKEDGRRTDRREKTVAKERINRTII